MSSIITYDIYIVSEETIENLHLLTLYQKYINPNATEAQTLRMGHAGVGYARIAYTVLLKPDSPS